MASNDGCERCLLEDKLVLDTQRFDQRVRSWVYRPARVRRTARVPLRTEARSTVPRGQNEAVIRRTTFIPPLNGLDLDAKLIPTTGRRRLDD
jgi:hypothetical protein